ncbi:MAG: ATP synthase F1 subunit epsilon [Candidatus Riflebacteria bacterium]|nr:ATP synthase F1 subunit epsilon [Candidatus Riflebacteria bacterium]
MQGTPFHLEVVTPEGRFFDGEVICVTAPGILGSFGVLANHAPFVSALSLGEMKIHEASGRERDAALFGGFFEVAGNRAVVVADEAEWVETIDLPRAERAYQRAHERVMEMFPGIDRERARRALERARLRMRLAHHASPAASKPGAR